MQASETSEAWESMLLGLAELFKGLATEPGLPELGSSGQAHYLSRDALETLLHASASADARSAVLAIAGAQSGSQASADLQSRCLAQLSSFEACSTVFACMISRHRELCPYSMVQGACRADMRIIQSASQTSCMRCIGPACSGWVQVHALTVCMLYGLNI
jgi:hypothetical protein